MTTMHELIIRLRDSLTPEIWNKGGYFKAIKNRTETVRICMCVHGAAQALVNPKLRQFLASDKVVNVPVSSLSDIRDIALAAHELAFNADPLIAAASANADTIMLHFSNEVYLAFWNNRPDYVRKDNEYGNADIHYLLGMFGLTANFNDNANTTLEMIHERLNLAAAWAKENDI